ncbi:Uncharacterized protein TCM_038196 [Theobroma cacao]|uniref:Prolamin-like domain-containing protein n=1 Tax=Theobroma cacao TaxID=3641 RepID=A0A061GN20_THECC|nr:Uncharacterized protein TCM_038196 [Theobroma cacao]
MDKPICHGIMAMVLALCVAAMVQPGQSQMAPESQLFIPRDGNIPPETLVSEKFIKNLFPKKGKTKKNALDIGGLIAECLGNYDNVKDCVAEVQEVFTTGDLQGMAQLLLPPFSFSPTSGVPGLPWQPGEIQKCWSSLTSIEGCIMEVYTSLFRGQVGIIGPACCQAITQIKDNCWPKMFPFNPFFPPLLKTSCSATPPAGTLLNDISKLSATELLPVQPGNEVAECWSSLTNSNGCLLQIFKSLPSGQIGAIGPACCKAITEIKDNCWPKLFPFNPFFPPLLKNFCAQIGGLAPAPK